MVVALRSLFRKSSVTSVELREALVGLSTKPAEQRVNELEAERRRLLLDGTDDELAAIEQKISTANLELERTDARIKELHARLAQAEIDETVAVLTAEKDAVEAEACAVAAILSSEYPQVARRMVEILTRLQRAETAVEKINEKLVRAGRTDERLGEVEWRTFARPIGQHAPLFSILRAQLPEVAGVSPGFTAAAF